MKDLLLVISITAPVFHFEMSELKAELEPENTSQTKSREGFGGSDFINVKNGCQQQQQHERVAPHNRNNTR